MAVRTGGPGAGGISILVVPLLNHPGVEMRPIKTGGGSTSGTTFIDLDDVKVPVENLVGVVSDTFGFYDILILTYIFYRKVKA